MKHKSLEQLSPEYLGRLSKEEPAKFIDLAYAYYEKRGQRFAYYMDKEGVMPGTPETHIETIDEWIPTSPLILLLGYRKNCHELERNYKARYGEPHKGLELLRWRINSHIRKRKETQGSSPFPSTIIRNSSLTKEIVGTYGELYLENNEITTGPEIAQEFEAVLADRTSGLILDGIASYVGDYFERGPSDTMFLSESTEGNSYIIRTSFQEFAERIDAHGDDRAKIKQSLFSPKERGSLEYVKLIVPGKNKKRAFINVRFISAKTIVKEERENLLSGRGSALVGFELEINASLFDYLEHRGDIATGKKPKTRIESFQMHPKALTAKIDRTMQLAEKIARDNPQLAALKRKDFRPVFLYIMNRWNTGLQNRSNNMEVTWEELSDKGLLPNHKHSSRKYRRLEDMNALYMICRHMHDEEKVFSKCATIVLENRKKIIFRLSEGK